MSRYGRDFSRSRWEEDRPWGRDREEGGYGYGGMRSEGRGRMFNGFNEDSDEMSGFGPGGGSYDEDFEPGYRGRYGGSGMGGYMASGWSGGRGYEGREERDLGGYERGYGGQWSGRSGRPGGYGTGGRFSGRGAGDFGGRGGMRGQGMGDELRRLRAADIMTENPECVTPDVSLADAARKMRDMDVGIIPVVESDGNRRLRGVITDRDIAIRAVADGRDGASTRVSDVMTTEVETCNKNDPIQNVLRLMEREQVRRVPITDREGRLVGIVAQADVAMELDDHRSEMRVADTIERISQPSHGDRGTQGGGMRGRSSMGGSASTARTGSGLETHSDRGTLNENL